MDLPGALLVFGLFPANPDSTLSKLTLASVDQSGNGLTEWFALSRDDETLRLSPDGTKLASYRLELPSWNRSFQVYDLAAGTVTELGLPPHVVVFPGAFCWSPDSAFVVYPCVAKDPTTGG